jgi:hypothetical protein
MGMYSLNNRGEMSKAAIAPFTLMENVPIYMYFTIYYKWKDLAEC